MSADIDLLIGDHLDGTLDADGRRRLDAWLAEPANRRRFLERVFEHQALFRLAPAVTTTARRRRRQLRPRAAPRWCASLAIAAGLAVAILGWWLTSAPSATTAPVVGGPVVTGAEGATVAIGQVLAPGTSLTTAADGTVSLRWPDGSRVEVQARSTVEVLAGLHLRLGQGRITAEIAPQPADDPARFTTADAEVTVVGTGLAVACADGESSAEVSHGRVRVRRLADAAEVMVDAGTCVAIAPGLPLRVRPTGSPAGTVHQVAVGADPPADTDLRPGDEIVFAAGSHHGAWRIAASGTALRPLRIRGEDPAATSIDATGLPVDGDHSRPRAVLQLEGRHVEVSGLALTGARNGSNAAGIRMGAGAGDIRIRDCRISGCDLGLLSDHGSGDLLLADSTVCGNGTPARPGHGHNLDLAGLRSIVRGCRIEDAPQGLDVKLHGGHVELVGNRIGGGADGEIAMDLAPGAGGTLVLLGDLVVGRPRAEGWNRARFISMIRSPGAGPGRLLLGRSTLVGGDAHNLLIDAPDCSVVVDACILAGSGQVAGPGTVIGGSGSWLPGRDPGFTDPASGDFSLRTDSPCIGASGPPAGWNEGGRQRSLMPDLVPPEPGRTAEARSTDRDLGAFPAR